MNRTHSLSLLLLASIIATATSALGCLDDNGKLYTVLDVNPPTIYIGSTTVVRLSTPEVNLSEGSTKIEISPDFGIKYSTSIASNGVSLDLRVSVAENCPINDLLISAETSDVIAKGYLAIRSQEDVLSTGIFNNLGTIVTSVSPVLAGSSLLPRSRCRCRLKKGAGFPMGLNKNG